MLSWKKIAKNLGFLILKPLYCIILRKAMLLLLLFFVVVKHPHCINAFSKSFCAEKYPEVAKKQSTFHLCSEISHGTFLLQLATFHLGSEEISPGTILFQQDQRASMQESMLNWKGVRIPMLSKKLTWTIQMGKQQDAIHQRAKVGVLMKHQTVQ